MTRFAHHLMPDLSIPQKSLLLICKKYTKKRKLSPVSADLSDQEGKHFMEITNDPVIGHIKYERPGILVDRDDTLGVSHADNVLNGARNAAVDIQRRSDRASALPDEMCVRDPAFVHCDTGRSNRAVQKVSQLADEGKTVRAGAAATRYDHIRCTDILPPVGCRLQDLQQRGARDLFFGSIFDDLHSLMNGVVTGMKCP